MQDRWGWGGVGWRGGKGTMLSFTLYVSISLDLVGKILAEERTASTPIVTKEDI
jgi:hypothetical protein